MAINNGIAPPDFSTPVGLVRVLVGDTDPRSVAEGQGIYAWYSDAELAALLSVYGNNPRRVAIRVLESVAISRAMQLGKWSQDDLSVDGPAILTAMQKTIARLATELDDEESIADVYFDIVGTNETGFAEGAAFWHVPQPPEPGYPFPGNYPQAG